MELLLNPRLVGIGGPVEGGIFTLAEDEVTIGRDPSNRLPIDDPSVSRRHCAIRKQAAERFEIRDLGSRNGTVVNGLPVTARVLGDRDEIRLGNCRLQFRLLESSAPSNASCVQFDGADLETQTLLRLGPGSDPWALEPVLDQAAARSRVSSSLAVLIKIGTGIPMARGTEEIARQLLECIFEAIPAERGAVLLFDGTREEPVFGYCRKRDGGPSTTECIFDVIPAERSVLVQFDGTRDLPVIACCRKPDRGPNTTVRVSSGIVAQTRHEGIAILASEQQPDGSSRSVLAAPVRSQDTTLGVIYLESRDPRVAFDEEHLQLAAAIGSMLGVPFENARHLEWLEAENRRLREATDIEHDMVGASLPMREVFQFVGKAAPTGSTILILGESGTGKELVARAIHRNSPRAGRPFVAINCAALTETLLESELFGHEKGAFTGAIGQKQGKLEIADGGTLFLDEVGELPLAFQTKLLRVLQEREFERVGGARPIRVDVRLIAATNRDLESAIASNAFRKDLYYRLNVVSLAMPPLRDRREDIPLLARYFAAKHGKRAKRRLAGLSPEALACLEAYDWPGNVRELENALERAVVLGSTELIIPEDLPEAVIDTSTASEVTGGYYQTVREEKKRSILAALGRSGGNYTEAAKLLGVHANYLHRLVRNLNLKEEVKKASGS